MKMEYLLKAPKNDIVEGIGTQLGENVLKSDIYVSFAEETLI